MRFVSKTAISGPKSPQNVQKHATKGLKRLKTVKKRNTSADFESLIAVNYNYFSRFDSLQHRCAGGNGDRLAGLRGV